MTYIKPYRHFILAIKIRGKQKNRKTKKTES